jgi:Domain of unknown function (DUF6134)
MTRNFLYGAALCAVALVAQLALATGALAAARAENHFGSISIDGKKAGQIHYTVEYDENGEVETLRTRASLSILGIKLFNFEQNLHEAWRQGELQTLKGRTDDDGKMYNSVLDRASDSYQGTLNDKPVELPGNAFPASVWHYRITEQSLLFDLKDLRLMHVQIAKSNETIEVGKVAAPTERFDITGDWQASLWFDQNKLLVKFAYQVEGHKVTVDLDE